jgi:hypothetical protein
VRREKYLLIVLSSLPQLKNHVIMLLILQTAIIIVWRAWQSPYGDVGVDSENAMPKHA